MLYLIYFVFTSSLQQEQLATNPKLVNANVLICKNVLGWFVYLFKLQVSSIY